MKWDLNILYINCYKSNERVAVIRLLSFVISAGRGAFI